MSAWLKRFTLHMAAAIGATSIFVGAAAVGANQTRQTAAVSQPVRSTAAAAGSKPTLTVAHPSASAQSGSTVAQPSATSLPAGAQGTSPAPNQPRRTPTPGAPGVGDNVAPERSLAGTVVDVLPDALDVLGVGGRAWRVSPVPGALIRLNGKAVHLDALHSGDTVAILGQAQPRDGGLSPFLAHAITARHK